ncbi:hypothetical protein TUM19329_08460 [Legionella antarctica]|uniref:Uncharacterized protein n=1 Tax=Legionella antarctica TaxID=2708020 RepID=A0A6F8T1F2_9GAMM|nr:hypothetical protein [Legionella antarctica]BCA94485.1 hypothetical protein TUM19329_08460 [Legionella antarctica]
MKGKLTSESANAFITLVKFIQKSSLVKDSTFLEGEIIKEGAVNLKKALDDGDSTQSIFNDQNCQLYLIYLLKENLIKEEQFLTGYVYLSVLMQFTEKQLIHPEHAGARRLNWGKVCVFNSKDTSLLHIYAKNIEKKFEFLISAKDIVDYFSSATDSEEWIIGIPYNTQDKNDDVKTMMDTNIQFSPLLQIHTYQDQTFVLTPSTGFTKWLLQKLNSERQIELAPCFGNVGVESLYDYFHSKNKHPITLHSAYIKSNPKKIHQLQAGPVSFALHDIFFHCFGATVFNVQEFYFLMQIMIPTLQKIIDSETGGPKLMALKMRDILNDLAFSSRNFLKQNKLQNYLSQKLHSSMYGSNEWGMLNEDDLLAYFSVLQKICQILYQQKDVSTEYISNLLNNVINMSFIDDVEFDNSTSRREALGTVANVIINLKIADLSTDKMSLKLTDYFATQPEICLMINRAGYEFLPPLHSFPEPLLNEALLISKHGKVSSEENTMGTNPFTLFSHEAVEEASTVLSETEGKKSSG